MIFFYIKLSYLLVKLTNFYIQVDLFIFFYHHSSNYNTFYWNDELRESFFMYVLRFNLQNLSI